MSAPPTLPDLYDESAHKPYRAKHARMRPTEPLPVINPEPPGPEYERLYVRPQEERKQHDHSPGCDDRSLRAARRRATRTRVRPVVPANVAALTLTVVIPAHNEERDLGETLDALMRQTVAPERIVVVDDGSTDRTSAVAAQFPVEIVRNETPLGNKARVVNYVAPAIDTDLIINLDADTILCDDYIERVKIPFADPEVAVAAGIVLTWNPRGLFQRSRSIEYLFGQHLYRPIQNAWGSITVCPGCACVYRREPFVKAGGFPEGTIAEDMAYTLSVMVGGFKTVYVQDAECYVVDPRNARQLKAQLWRWLDGYYQCIRVFGKDILRRKRILALLLIASIWDIFSLPILAVSPFVFEPSGVGAEKIIEYIAIAWLSSDIFITLPVVLYGAHKRAISLWWALVNFPLIWINRTFNLYYATKALIWEMFLVPLGWAQSLGHWEKGH